MRERNLCDQYGYRFHPKHGRLESVHFLKPKGKWYIMKYCGMQESDIKIEKGKVPIYEQYEHRKKTISVHIAFRKALEELGLEVTFYNSYFEKNDRICSTRIQSRSSSLIADSIFLLKHEAEVFLFCIEVHNQYRVKRITAQLRPYLFALAEGHPSLKHNIPKSARVLVIFEKKSTLTSTLEQLACEELFSNFKDYFLFKHYEEMPNNPL